MRLIVYTYLFFDVYYFDYDDKDASKMANNVWRFHVHYAITYETHDTHHDIFNLIAHTYIGQVYLPIITLNPCNTSKQHGVQ
jgi:hypothetical protein